MKLAPDEQGLKADIVTEQVKTRRRSTKAEQRAETIEQILDEAEYLFSKHGLHGVTLKDVAKRVGVHHTLLNYYFEDKKKLFDAVFARRAVVTSTERMRALDEYDRATDGKPTIEGALHAFLDTDLDLYIHGGDGWKNYGALGAQVANTPEWAVSTNCRAASANPRISKRSRLAWPRSWRQGSGRSAERSRSEPAAIRSPIARQRRSTNPPPSATYSVTRLSTCPRRSSISVCSAANRLRSASSTSR